VKWTVAKARQRFSEVLRRAGSEPQAIYNRDKLVAAVIDADSFQEFWKWRSTRTAGKTVAAAFEELRAVSAGDATPLESVPREDRDNAFASMLDDDELAR
jgi:antitoxin (DNA-binding transcriptional repressor) of toxin-antitoxin stability system